MIPSEVGKDEELGRRIFSEGVAKRARRGRVPPRLFRDTKSPLLISTDRLSIAPSREANRLAREASANRSGPFRGWAVVACDRARQSGRDVIASPQNGNPYHSNIVLPPDADRESYEWHTQELARTSKWRAGTGDQQQ